VDFLLASIELYSLGVTAVTLRAIIGWKSAILLKRGPVDPKFQVEGVAPTNHSSSQKTRLNVITYMVYKSGQIFLPFCHNLRVWRTDRQTEFSSLDRVCIQCSAVKIGAHCAENIKRDSDSFIGFKTIIGTAYLGTEGRRLISVQLSSLGRSVKTWACRCVSNLCGYIPAFACYRVTYSVDYSKYFY